MKTITRIISLFMVALILTTSVPFTPVSAVDVGTENYTLNMEKTYADSSLAESSAVGGMSFFGSAEFDGCYGNQLSGVAREIYDSLVKNYVTDKITGEYTHTFETPFTFDAEISGGSIVMNDELEEIDIEIGYAVQAAMDAFLYDHPEVFWLRIIGSSYGVSASGNDVSGYTGIIDDITIIPTEIYSGASSKLSQYESAVDSVIGVITVTESRYDTLKNIHDYICNNAWYNLVSEQRVHSSEPFFIGDGGVVCEGYAKTFKILCDRLEIPCVLVSGDAGGAHMWNYVQMDDGKWYLVDVTWDDQESKIYDTYFLTGAYMIGFNDMTIIDERTERNDFSGTGIFSFNYPDLSAVVYTVHVHEWDGDYTFDVEPTCTEKGSKSIHCKICKATKSMTEIPATNHANKTEHAQQDATCTKNGYTAGVYCSDCEKWLEGHDIITSEGHTDENNDVFCDVCEEYLSKVIKTDTCGDSAEYSFYEDGMLIISGKGSIYGAFDSFRYDIKSVEISEGITEIGYEAFCQYINLESVKLPSTLKTIDDCAFYSCRSLKDLVLPSGLTSVGDLAFAECSSLNYVTMPEGITYIGGEAFGMIDEFTYYIVLHCKKGSYTEKWSKENNHPYVAVDAPESENTVSGTLGNRLTWKLDKLSGVLEISGTGSLPSNAPWKVYIPYVRTLKLSEGITSVNSDAFDGVNLNDSMGYTGLYNLEKLYLPSTLTDIGGGAFYRSNINFEDVYAASLESWMKINFYVECGNLYGNPMAYANNLYFDGKLVENLVIPEGTKYIKDYTFQGCNKIKTVILPEGLEYIGEKSFGGCNLSSVKIPSTVDYIESNAFEGCWDITEFEFSLDENNLCKITSLPNLSIKEIILPASIKYGSFGSETEKVTVYNTEFKFNDGCGLDYNSTIVGFKGSTAEAFANEICATFIDVETIHTHEYKSVNEKGYCSFDRCICGKVQKGLKHTDVDSNAKCDNCSSSVNDIEIGITDTVYINMFANYDFWYTVTKSGKYTFSADDDFSGTLSLYSEEENWLAGSNDNKFSYKLKAGQKVKFKVYSHIDGMVTVNLTYEEVPCEHDYNSYILTQPTCTDTGAEYYECSVCGDTYTEFLSNLGHRYASSYTTDKKATCTTEGSKSRHCTRDGCTAKTSVTAISKLAHNYTNACDKDCNVCKATRTPAAHKGGTATCTKKAKCSVCGAYYGSLKAHSYRDVITKASLSKNGKVENKCTTCGYISKTTVIYAPKTVNLSAASYTYNGKVKTPSVTVKDSKGKKLKNGTDYTVKYSKGRKSIGKYTVTVTFKGNYSGTKKLTFEIIPAKVTLSKLTAGSKALTATWKAVSGVTGYEVQYSTSKKFTSKTTKTVKIKSSKTKKTTIKKLTKGKKYYVRIRAYKTVSKKPVYGAWSSVKNIKVK